MFKSVKSLQRHKKVKHDTCECICPECGISVVGMQKLAHYRNWRQAPGSSASTIAWTRDWCVMNIIIIIMIKCFISIYFQSIMFSMKYEWSKFVLKIWKASIRHYFIKRNHITISSIYYNIVVTWVDHMWLIVPRLSYEFYKTRNFSSSVWCII